MLQRHYLWIFLVLSGLAGIAVANLTTTLISGLSQPDETIVEAQLATTTAARPTKTLATYQPIISRNIFNSALSGQPEPVVTRRATQATGMSSWALVGTLSGGTSPSATLRDKTTTTTYRLDEELPDGATLSAIARNRVTLRYPSGRTVTLAIDEQPVREIQPKPRSARTTAQRDLQIANLGENRWQIPTAVANVARTNIGEVLKQAHAIPYLESGQTTGFQIQMIVRGSLIDNLGLKKGDILRKVNGLELNSPEKALQIFGQLRQAKQIRIDLERRGKAMTFAYEIR